MAKEQIADFVVSITFDDAMKKLKAFDDKMGGFHKKQQQASVRLKSMQQVQYKQLQANIRQTQREENHAWKQKERIEKEIRRAERAAYKEKSTREDRFQKDIRGAYRTNAALDKKNSDRAVRNAERVARARSKAAKRESDNLKRAQTSALTGTLFDKKTTGLRGADATGELKRKILTSQTAKEVRIIAALERQNLRNLRFQTQERKKQSFWMRRMQSSSEQMAGNMVSAFAAVGAVTGVTMVGQNIEATSNAMLAVSKNAEDANKNLEFVKETSRDLGLNFNEAAKGYSQFLAAGKGKVSESDIREIFLGVTEASTAMGLSVDDTNGSIRAISQMLSKGKIQAEELNYC